MLKKRYYLTVILVILTVSFICSSAINSSRSVPLNDSSIGSQDRVLIIAPHPDDESIACAGVIRYCVDNNIPVEVVVLTDGSLGASATTRHDETVHAMNLLGVKSEDVLFLGYRDGTLPVLLNRNWEPNRPDSINGTINNSNYIFSYQRNAIYSGEDLYNNLVGIIQNFQPTIVFYPDSEDEQIDHWGANAFVEYALDKTNYTGNRYNYIVHDPPDWPSPRTYNPEGELTPPPELTAIGYKWVSFPMSEYNERIKEDAFNMYPSQINNDSYLRSFIKPNEVFSLDQVKLVNLSNTSIDFFHSNSSPETVIQEPVKKDKGLGSIRSRELTTVGFELDSQNAWISVKTNDNISRSSWYEVHILYLDPDKPGRIDLKIYNGTASYQNVSSDSYRSNDIQVNSSGKLMKIRMPSSAFNDVNSFLICADMTNGISLVDWTAWRDVEINRMNA